MYGTQINHLLLQGLQSPLLANLWLARPTPAEQEAKGQIIIMLEMPGRGSRTQVAINEFIKSIETAYYNAATETLETGLEHALRLVNTQLPALVGSLDKRWTEKTTMLVAVHKNDWLYFSHIGKAWGMFMTPTKAMVITENTKNQAINPLKPFSFIASGQLPPESAICLTTTSLLDYIASEKLRKLCLQLPPLGVIQNLEELLINASPQLNIMAVIMRHMVVSSSLFNQQTTKPITNRLNKLAAPPTALPNSEQSIKNLASRRTNTAKLLSVPNLRQNALIKIKSLGTGLGRAIKKLTNKSVWQQWRQANRKNITVARTALDNFNKRWRRTMSLRWWLPAIWLKGLALGLSSTIIKIKKINRHGQIILGLLALALIVFSQGILWQAQTALPTNSSLPPNLVATAQNLVTQATNALIYGDEQKSISLLTDLQNQLNSLNKQQQQDPLLQPIWSTFNDLQNRLGKIIVLTSLSNVVALTGQNPRGLVKIDNNLWTSTNSGLAKINIKDGSINNVNTLAASLITADNKNIYLINNNQAIFIDQNGKTTELKWTKVPAQQTNSAIMAYNGRLYILDSFAGQIFRYQRNGSDLVNGTAWLKQPLGANTSRDMTLDGSLYLLTNGNVQKFTQGNIVANFSLKGLWPPMQQPTVITIGNQYLYVLEPTQQRLIIISKQTGKLDRQYRSPLLQNATAITVEPTERLAYVIIGNDIKKIDLMAR